MSLIKSMFGKFKKALKAAVYFIGYSIINTVSAAALVGGICGMYFTAVAISQLALAPAAYLALQTYILMRIGKRVGLKIVDYILERSGMVDQAYNKPNDDFFKVVKPKNKISDDDESSAKFSAGFSLDYSWNVGPFSISLPWAGYSKSIPLDIKDLKNYFKIGFNYLFNKLGLKDRADYLANTKYAQIIQQEKDEIEMMLNYSPIVEAEIRFNNFNRIHKPFTKVMDELKQKHNKTPAVQNTTRSEQEIVRLTQEKRTAMLKEKQVSQAKLFALNSSYDLYKQELGDSESGSQSPEIGTQMMPAQHANRNIEQPTNRRHKKKNHL